jgi:hypothetical protein
MELNVLSLNVPESNYTREGAKVMPPAFFSESVIAITMKFTRMFHIPFAIMRLFCHKVCIIFNTILLTLSKTLYTRVVKYPARTSQPTTSGARKLQKNCDSASVESVLTET